MASGGVALDTAAIVSTVVEGILYGFSVLMFIATISVVFQGRRGWREVNRSMLTVSCLLLILSTIHIAVDIKRIHTGFVTVRDTYPGGPVAFFASVTEKTFVIKNALYSLQTVVGDGVVIYRCYKVWRNLWIIVLPAILWCAVLTTAAGCFYAISQPNVDSSNVFVGGTGKWITSFYATTLACNLTATSLLAYKLWTVERRVMGRVGKGATKYVLRIIIDAGALYSFALFAALLCFVNRSNGQYVVLDMVTPIISIAFYMIILRVALASHRAQGNNTSSSMSRSFPRTMESHRLDDPSYQMRPMQVHIDQLTEVSPPYAEDKGEDLSVNRSAV